MLYNVQLGIGGSSLSVGGTVVLTIGHGITNGFVAPHSTYGNWNKVNAWLTSSACKQVEGAPTGQLEAVRGMPSDGNDPTYAGFPVLAVVVQNLPGHTRVAATDVLIRVDKVGELIHNMFNNEVPVSYAGDCIFYVDTTREKIQALCNQHHDRKNGNAALLFAGPSDPVCLTEPPAIPHLRVKKDSTISGISFGQLVPAFCLTIAGKALSASKDYMYLTFSDTSDLKQKARTLKDANPNTAISMSTDGKRYDTLVETSTHPTPHAPAVAPPPAAASNWLEQVEASDPVAAAAGEHRSSEQTPTPTKRPTSGQASHTPANKRARTLQAKDLRA